MINLKLLFFLTFILSSSIVHSFQQRPNVIIITADDLGWNDVSFHDRAKQIPTPNIDALGMNGVILNRHYTQPGGTASRAALMTGEYPIHIGMSQSVIESDQPWGLPLDKKLLPEHFRDVGYSTYLVGKWDLGFWKKSFTPLQRGFDHHYGFWGQNVDYWTKKRENGRDFRKNYDVLDDNNTYITDLLTEAAIEYINNHPKNQPLFMMVNHLAPHIASGAEHLQAPLKEIAKFDHIKNTNRKMYVAMVSKLDQNIGKLIASLKEANILDNSIILFLSDNGAPTSGKDANHGSNYPFRGQKLSPWEGGIRVPALIWSPLIHKRQRISNEMIHVSDWVPTLLAAVGVYPNFHVDGIDQWPTIAYGLPSRRTELLVNINPIKGWGAIIKNGWKLVKGTETNDFNEWLSNPNQLNLHDEDYVEQIMQSDVYKALGTIRSNEILQLAEEATVFCGPLPLSPAFKCKATEVCLFNLNEDKCEYYNVASLYPQKVHELGMALLNYAKTTQIATISPADPDSNPAYYNGVWTYWGDLVHTIFHGFNDMFNSDQGRLLQQQQQKEMNILTNAQVLNDLNSLNYPSHKWI